MSTVGFLWNGLFNLNGDYVETVKGIEPVTGRLLLSFMFAAGVPAWLIAGSIPDRWRNIPLMVTILIGFAVAVIGLTIVDGFILVAVFSGLIGYLFFSLIPVMGTHLLSTFPDRHRGSSYAWYSSSMMTVIAFGSGGLGTVVTLGATCDTVSEGWPPAL